MSLAGLDAPAVTEAYHASIAEPSGWFLLRYVDGTRDTVELLKRGSNGVSETRIAVETYTDKSPLYGLIQYRRRKIILKYVPDGTSRVLQVRLTVQFQAVLDAFTPHDTIFSFATAPELTEADLAMAIMRLPPTNSLTSSSSSAQRRLNEISEDVEEPEAKESAPQAQTTVTATQERPDTDTDLDELPASALRAKALLSKRKDVDMSPEHPVSVNPPPAAAQTIVPTLEAASHPPMEEGLAMPVAAPLPSPSNEKDLPAIPNSCPPVSYGLSEFNHETSEEPATTEPSHPSLTSAYLEHARQLSATDSDSIQEWSNNVASFSTIKPKKKKLGPRPHVEGPSRPRTSGNSEAVGRTRPVANLPTSVRITTARPIASATYRPSSQQSSKSVPGRFPPPETPAHIMPPIPSPTHIASMYRPVSRASRGRPASITAETANVIPEKLRLMKALQLRKRNMLMAQRASASTAANNGPSESLASTNTTHTNLPEPVDSKGLLTSSTASPTTLTNLSEVRSKASSFTSLEGADKRRGSLSSDTSSSVTPKATIEGEKKRKSPKRSPKTASPPAPIEESVTKPEQQPEVAPAPAPTQARGSASLRVDTDSTVLDKISRGASLSSSASRKRRGRPVPEHLTMINSAEISELSEEDSMMDELENATVHEAQPVSVSRTPVTPVMSRVSTFAAASRSVSTPVQTRPLTQPRAQSQARTQSTDSLDKPKSAGARSFSTALPNWPPLPSEPLPLTTKSTVGSGISKRIKALEVLSTRTSTSPPHQPVKSDPATRSAFSKFMKRSSVMLDTHQAPNASTENSPPKKMREPSPPKVLPPVLPQPWVQRQGSGTQVFHPTQKGETVSVTARIIRDENEESNRTQTDPNDISLYQSPLIVEHERQGGDMQGDMTSADSRSLQLERGRFSFSSQRLHTSDSFASKLSITGTGRKHLPKSQSDNSSMADEKTKPSRANRLMKRVSNLAAMRRNPKSPGIIKSPSSVSQIDINSSHQPVTTIEERIEPDPRNASTSESLLHVVDIGDVNVQFPESLLWKRRFIRIDDQGFLIFSPPANEAHARSVSRKFHLNDFRKPVLPDPEREEMAWSIIMDLKDGRSLQYACESSGMQQQVLQMLVDAHSAYRQLYGN